MSENSTNTDQANNTLQQTAENKTDRKSRMQTRMEHKDQQVMNTASTEMQNYVRRGPDRRRNPERRDDPREQDKRSFKLWFKSIFKPRVGVDRRKGQDRRRSRSEFLESRHSSLLTQEELNQLLER